MIKFEKLFILNSANDILKYVFNIIEYINSSGKSDVPLKYEIFNGDDVSTLSILEDKGCGKCMARVDFRSSPSTLDNGKICNYALVNLAQCIRFRRAHENFIAYLIQKNDDINFIKD